MELCHAPLLFHSLETLFHSLETLFHSLKLPLKNYVLFSLQSPAYIHFHLPTSYNYLIISAECKICRQCRQNQQNLKFFHHFPYLRQFHMRSIRVTIRLADITHNTPQRLLAPIAYRHSDMIDSWPSVVFILTTAAHMMRVGMVWVSAHDCIIFAKKTRALSDQKTIVLCLITHERNGVYLRGFDLLVSLWELNDDLSSLTIAFD